MSAIIITTATTVLVTLLITYAFNGVVGFPKKKRQKAEEEKKKLDDFKTELLTTVAENDEKIYSELKKQSETDNTIVKSLKLCNLGLQTVIKDNLKNLYEKWIKKGYSPISVKEDLENMYQVYHQLGANGVMDGLRDKFLALPEGLSKKNKE